MKIKSLRWGVILLGIGITALAVKFDYLDSYVWRALLALWPVFIIAIGIELIFRNTRLHYLALISPLLIAAAFIYAGFTADSSDWNGRWHSFSWYNQFDDDSNRETKHFGFDKDSAIKNLSLDIDFGAGEIQLRPTSSELFSADFEYRRHEPSCTLRKTGDSGKISVKSTDFKTFAFINNGRIKNDARIFVNDSIPLDIFLDASASSVDFDLSDLMVKNLRLESGASSIDLRLGCRSNKVSIKIDSGASRVKIWAPKEMGLRFVMDTALSSTNFRDLDITKYNGGYKSTNYETASCQTDIDVDSGVSSLEVQYY